MTLQVWICNECGISQAQAEDMEDTEDGILVLPSIQVFYVVFTKAYWSCFLIGRLKNACALSWFADQVGEVFCPIH